MQPPSPGKLPPVICVVGFKDTGKTGVAVRLIGELRRRGHRVGAIKHGHRFDIDRPGTDSWRLRHEGGGDPVLLAGPEGFALQGGWGPQGEPTLERMVRSVFPDAGIVVVEGFKGDSFPKVEVHRRHHHPGLIYRPGSPGSGAFLAIVTDDPELRLPIRRLPLNDPETPSRLADLVEVEVLGVIRKEVPSSTSAGPS